MSIHAKGRALGYTNEQIRKIMKEQFILQQRERWMQDVLECENIEDIKILLLDWIDKGMLVETKTLTIAQM